MTKNIINTIFSRLKKNTEAPTTELIYQTPFELLVSVVLSAQATDISVNKATGKLFAVANTPETLLDLGIEGLIPYIKAIGLYNSKAHHIIKLCEILLNDFQGQVPRQREDLERLPGVGRKTASVVLNVAFGELTIAVDTHVFRVSHRLGLASAKTPDAVEKQLLEIVPKKFQRYAHHWLILHGRHVCKARKPLCDICLLQDLCPYFATVDKN